jgi:hypothetical protein
VANDHFFRRRQLPNEDLCDSDVRRAVAGAGV